MNENYVLAGWRWRLEAGGRWYFDIGAPPFEVIQLEKLYVASDDSSLQTSRTTL